jgi:predicted kinase
MDAVEFNRRISVLDVARDTGFLQMDLEYRGRPDLADAFIRRYLELAHDPDHREVLPFYAYYSACVRGKVENFLLDIPSLPEREKRAAAKRARRYFEMAVEYAKTLPPAMLVITCGLSGSGKSSVARELAPVLRDAEAPQDERGAVIIASDVVRKRLAGLDPKARMLEEYRVGVYSPAMTERTYRAMLDEARPLLLAGQSVILDAAYLRRADRRAASRLARETGAQFACVLVSADEREVRRRLAERLEAGADPSDARWEIYVRQKRRFQRPTEVPAERLIEVEASRAFKREVRDALRRVRAISPLSVTPL